MRGSRKQHGKPSDYVHNLPWPREPPRYLRCAWATRRSSCRQEDQARRYSDEDAPIGEPMRSAVVLSLQDPMHRPGIAGRRQNHFSVPPVRLSQRYPSDVFGFRINPPGNAEAGVVILFGCFGIQCKKITVDVLQSTYCILIRSEETDRPKFGLRRAAHQSAGYRVQDLPFVERIVHESRIHLTIR